LSAPPTPWPEFSTWYAEAVASEPDVPDAMQVATVDARGFPSVRTVLLKDFGPDGLVFYTNLTSRKGRELHARPRAAAVLHWKSLQRQALFEGPVERVDDATADAYFATRPRGSQLGAWASHQSAPIGGRAELEAALAEVVARFGDGPVARPPHWSGFRIRPERVELWQGRRDRLHDRRTWRVDADAPGGWVFELLQP
jgi:pyridoxamine 5'-phosphate oxidase